MTETQYKPEIDTVDVMETAGTPILKQLSLAGDPQVQRIRKIFMIIVGLCLVLDVVNWLSSIFGSRNESSTADTGRRFEILEGLISILIHLFGLFAARRHSAKCLRIFAWIFVIQLVLISTVLVIVIFATVTPSTAENRTVSIIIAFVGSATLKGYTLAATLSADFLVTLISTILAFKLARLIDAKKRLNAQQI